MFPNFAVGLFTSLLPSIISSVTGPSQPSGSVVTVSQTSSVTGLVSIIVSTAFAVLGAAGFGDAIHNFAAVAGTLGMLVATVNHMHLIGGSNANTLTVIGNLLDEIAKYKDVPVAVAETPASQAPQATLPSHIPTV
jgi:hypothetical protein